jgi:hypothetical protein
LLVSLPRLASNCQPPSLPLCIWNYSHEPPTWVHLWCLKLFVLLSLPRSDVIQPKNSRIISCWKSYVPSIEDRLLTTYCWPPKLK